MCDIPSTLDSLYGSLTHLMQTEIRISFFWKWKRLWVTTAKSKNMRTNVRWDASGEFNTWPLRASSDLSGGRSHTRIYNPRILFGKTKVWAPIIRILSWGLSNEYLLTVFWSAGNHSMNINICIQIDFNGDNKFLQPNNVFFI